MIAAGVVAPAAPAHAILYDRCEGAVVYRIAELGIDAADVAGVRTFPELAASRTGAIARGVKAWVRLTTCEDSVVIVTTKRCRVNRPTLRAPARCPACCTFSPEPLAESRRWPAQRPQRQAADRPEDHDTTDERGRCGDLANDQPAPDRADDELGQRQD